MPFYLKPEVGPTFTKEESILNESLLAALNAAAPPRRTLELFPPRYGYGPRRALAITDVIDLSRQTVADRRMDYSGSYGSYTGTERPGLGLL